MNPCGTILVTNNFSLTHEAGESQPPVFHSVTFPAAPSPPLCTNKPIMATDINWTPFLKMLPQPFFPALPYLAPITLLTRCAVCLHVDSYACTHCICTLQCVFCARPSLIFLPFNLTWFSSSIYSFKTFFSWDTTLKKNF